MRIGELAQQTGVSVATIKFYIRQGLLPPGRSLGPRQAAYEDSHVARLRLIRALVDVGGLSLTATAEVLAAADGPGGTAMAIAVAHGSLPPLVPVTGVPRRAQQALHLLGWQVAPDSSGVPALESALAAAESVGMAPDEARLRAYARAAMDVARVDVTGVADQEDPVRYVVLGTILYEPLLLALRRLAQQVAFQSGSAGDGPEAAGRSGHAPDASASVRRQLK